MDHQRQARHGVQRLTGAELTRRARVKPAELAKFLSSGRSEFQAWLDATIPIVEP